MCFLRCCSWRGFLKWDGRISYQGYVRVSSISTDVSTVNEERWQNEKFAYFPFIKNTRKRYMQLTHHPELEHNWRRFDGDNSAWFIHGTAELAGFVPSEHDMNNVQWVGTLSALEFLSPFFFSTRCFFLKLKKNSHQVFHLANRFWGFLSFLFKTYDAHVHALPQSSVKPLVIFFR